MMIANSQRSLCEYSYIEEEDQQSTPGRPCEGKHSLSVSTVSTEVQTEYEVFSQQLCLQELLKVNQLNHKLCEVNKEYAFKVQQALKKIALISVQTAQKHQLNLLLELKLQQSERQVAALQIQVQQLKAQLGQQIRISTFFRQRLQKQSSSQIKGSQISNEGHYKQVM